MPDTTTALPDPFNSDYDSPLPVPPLDPTIFSDDFHLSDNFISFDDQDFDITFDDLFLPSDTEYFLNSTVTAASDPAHEHLGFDPDSGCINEYVSDPEKSSESVSGDDITSGFLNIPLSSSSSAERIDHDPASSQGSGNGSEGLLNYPSPCSGNSANNSRNVASNSMNEVVDQKFKVEELVSNNNISVLKRKKENGEPNFESRTSKYRKSNGAGAVLESANNSSGNDDDEKKKARLIRNRESAQLSRQRKKHYVEELEDKVRAMHSTIQDLNAKISYIVAENASLRQQQMGVNGGVCPPPAMMYPHPGMGAIPYQWMPCPPYVVKQHGSQVPLVPIPRLKPQQPAAVAKAKKVEGKKGEGKTKKVASISFLGLLFFVMLFGGLVPMINVKFSGMRDAYSSGSNYMDNRLYDQHHGRVLTVNGHVNGTNHNIGVGFSGEKFGAGIGCGRGHDPNEQGGSNLFPGSDEFARNGSEPLIASLYVPRNDKLIKIDGNLIIHSVLASEKAMASRQETEPMTNKETGLAVALKLAPALPVTGMGMSSRRHPNQRQRALASEEEYPKSKGADGKLQQWFREGLAGPLLSSGMCTEVFQFDVSAASGSGAIVPATSVRNITAEHRQNTTYINKGRNRRILHSLPVPLPGSSPDNITKEHMGSKSENRNTHKNSSLSSSMVVSVLVDPREAGDGDGEGVMGKKSFSRIFVVVLLDSVKYVTYSCMLPLMGSSHVVTT